MCPRTMCSKTQGVKAGGLAVATADDLVYFHDSHKGWPLAFGTPVEYYLKQDIWERYDGKRDFLMENKIMTKIEN